MLLTVGRGSPPPSSIITARAPETPFLRNFSSRIPEIFSSPGLFAKHQEGADSACEGGTTAGIAGGHAEREATVESGEVAPLNVTQRTRLGTEVLLLGVHTKGLSWDLKQAGINPCL